MQFPFALPFDIQLEVLKLLAIRDLGVLDAAVCNRQDRQALLALFSDSRFIYCSRPIALQKFSAKWLVMRNIRINHLVISDSHIKAIVNNLDLKFCSAMRLNLSVYSPRDEDEVPLTSVIEKCPLLREMEMDISSYETLTKSQITNSKVLPQLTSLVLRGYDEVDPREVLKAFSESCSKLESVCIHANVDNGSFLQFFRRKMHLTVIDLGLVPHIRPIVQAVVPCCPHLIKFKLAAMEVVENWDFVALLFEHCHQLQCAKFAADEGFELFHFQRPELGGNSGNWGSFAQLELNNVNIIINARLLADLIRSIGVGTLHLVDIPEFPDDKLFEMVSGSNVWTVVLQGCGVTMDGLQRILQQQSHTLQSPTKQSPPLSTMQLDELDHLSNQDLITLFVDTPHHLTALTISNHTTVTNETAAYINERNPQLVDGCIFENCPLVAN